MKNSWLKYTFFFIALALLQVLVFNQMVLKVWHWFFVPQVYILAIMLLPFETRQEIVLLSGFALGLTVDLLSGTLALNTAAMVAVSYLRKPILTWIAPRMGYSSGTLPSYLFYGYFWFLKYTLLVTLIHHFVFYLLDIFSFRLLWVVLIKAVINALFSTVFILIVHYIFKNRPSVV